MVSPTSAVPERETHDTFLCLPLPWHLEDTEAVPTQALRSVTEGLFTGVTARDPHALAQHLAAPARAILARWRAAFPSGAAASGVSERPLDHDGYFGVRRLPDASPHVALGEAALVAYHRLLRDSAHGHSLGPSEFDHLHNAFGVLLPSAPALAASSPDALPSPTVAPPRTTVDARLRWRLGHHAFFVLIQAQILAHAQLAKALAQHHLPSAQDAFSRATQLWWGTAAAFRHTADFSTEDYERLVRPSMTPPFVQEGFSGLLSLDHAHLLRALRALQPSLRALPPDLHEAHRLYLRALDVAYEAHAFVCERFVGDGQSLKGKHRDTSASAPAALRRTFKARALRSAGG